MTPLEAFLKTEDLDELLRVRGSISCLSPEESGRIASLIQDWSDRQAVANLLFHPDLIPTNIRFEAIDRALGSHDIPYFVLAATVGLQSVALSEVPSDRRSAWTQALLGLVQSTSRVLAGRASVTLFAWSKSVTTSDILPALLSLYPVPDDGACRNIASAVLARCGELSVDEFVQQLSAWRVPGPTISALREVHEEYTGKKARDDFRAMIMKTPALDYIPNLSEGVAGIVESAGPEADRPHPRGPWWRFW